MSIDIGKRVTVNRLINAAKNLQKDEVDNTEYGRALVELIREAANITSDNTAELAYKIGVKLEEKEPQVPIQKPE